MFAFTSAVEFALAKKATFGRLSPEFANWAANKSANRTCDGDFFKYLVQGFEQYGICTETQLPYSRKFDLNLQPSEEAVKYSEWVKGQGLKFHWLDTKSTPGMTDTRLENIKRVIASGWPVIAGFKTGSAYPKWVGKVLIYRPPTDEKAMKGGGHSMVIAGYRDDETQPGGGTFVLIDSGSGRYGYTPYAYVKDFVMDHGWMDCGEPLQYPLVEEPVIQ